MACPLDDDNTSVVPPTTRRIAAMHTRGTADLPPIPHTRTEVDLIGRLYHGNPAPEEPPGSTRHALNRLSATGPYRILHLACHGLLDSQHPALSGLALTPDPHADPPDDGYWNTIDILNSPAPAHTIVLSACETGYGPQLPGEGLLGLTRAYYYAGAHSLCVSLWQISDTTTPQFMQGLHRRLKEGHPLAHAVQLAQLDFINVALSPHPRHWAAHTAHGHHQPALPPPPELMP